MKIILNKNGRKPRIELSEDLVKEMKLKSGDGLLLFSTAWKEYGFMKVSKEDSRTIVTAKVVRRKGLTYAVSKEPPMAFLFALFGVDKMMEFEIEKSKVLEDNIYLWKNGREI